MHDPVTSWIWNSWGFPSFEGPEVSAASVKRVAPHALIECYYLSELVHALAEAQGISSSAPS